MYSQKLYSKLQQDRVLKGFEIEVQDCSPEQEI